MGAADIGDVITCAIFGDCRLRGVGVVRGLSLPSPIDLRCRPYNTGHTTVWPCDYVLNTEWRKLDHSIVAAAISQWRRRLSACVRADGRPFFSTFCGVFMVQTVKLMLKIFDIGV